uniref:Muscarinic acetylcholine receptor n=1 Tax=Esox lucius TaxID=8010 RepID=A0A3P8ZDD2_ESOLU
MAQITLKRLRDFLLILLVSLSMNSSQIQTYEIPSCPYTTVELIVIVVVTGSLSFITVLGNILVMLSIKVNRRLQTVNNYFLFSLACADLIIGLLSMNLYTLYIIKGYWPLGEVVCDLWLALDYVVSNASVMNLLIISFDRYFCVTQPLTYPARRTTRLAGLMIAAAWLLSLFLWAPAILFWQSLVGKRIVPNGECYIQLLSNPAVTLVTTVPAFYLPAIIMIVLYARISFASRSNYTAELKRARPSSGQPKHSSLHKRSGVLTPKCVEHRNNSTISIEDETSIRPEQGIISHTWSAEHSTTKPSQQSLILNHSTETSAPGKKKSPVPGKAQVKGSRQTAVRERKVAKTISAVLLAFILTWTPYSVMAVIGTYCHFCIPGTMWTMGYWLCYINSTVNPVCYALCNVTFRKTFKNLLRCQFQNTEVK